MKIKGGIFDFDATLVDSMKTWHSLGYCYLIGKGYIPDENFWNNTKTMSIFLRLQNTFIMFNELNELVEEDYQLRIPLKEGVRDFLNTLCKKEVPRLTSIKLPFF